MDQEHNAWVGTYGFEHNAWVRGITHGSGAERMGWDRWNRA
jgi:hypothetical protein